MECKECHGNWASTLLVDGLCPQDFLIKAQAAEIKWLKSTPSGQDEIILKQAEQIEALKSEMCTINIRGISQAEIGADEE